MKFISEMTSVCSSSDMQLLESEDLGNGEKKAVFSARLQTMDERNQNGRVYPADVCRSIVAQLQPKARSRSLI